MNRWLYVGLLFVVVGCGGQTSRPPGDDPNPPPGGLPLGSYGCLHRYTIWNGTFYEHYVFHVDDLTILPANRYLSQLSAEEGGYRYDPATRTISYSGVYAEEGYRGHYQPASERDDGRHHLENVTEVEVDGETSDFVVNCLSE